MTTLHRLLQSRRSLAAGLVAASLLAGLFASTSAKAAFSQRGAPMVVINPGGSERLNGSDGIRIVVNADEKYRPYTAFANGWKSEDGADQIYFARLQFWNSNGPGPNLQIGGAASGGGIIVGNSGPAVLLGLANAVSWTSVSVVSTTGAVALVPAGTGTGFADSSTGSGSAVVRYEYMDATSGKTWVLVRTTSYTYPNRYYSDRFEITVPTGAPPTVFYTGGNAWVGNSTKSDVTGMGARFGETGPTGVIASDAGSETFLTYQQDPGSVDFDGLWGAAIGSVSAVKDAIRDGASLGFAATGLDDDPVLFAQWNLQEGTNVRTMTPRVGYRGVEASLRFDKETTVVGTPAQLVLEMLNSDDRTSEYGLTMALPRGMTVEGAGTTDCAGVLEAKDATITLTGGTLVKFSRCTVTVPVTSATAGTYDVSERQIVTSGALSTGFGVAPITFTAAPPATHDAGSTPAAKAKAPLTIAKASGSSTSISTSVRVTGAGRAVMTGVVAGKSAFTPTTRSFTKAGAATIRAALNDRVRALLRTRDVRVKITIRFTAADGRSTTSTRTVLLKKIQVRPEPVTG